MREVFDILLLRTVGADYASSVDESTTDLVFGEFVQMAEIIPPESRPVLGPDDPIEALKAEVERQRAKLEDDSYESMGDDL